MKDLISLITAITGLVGVASGAVISFLTLRHTYRKDVPIIRLSLSVAMITDIKMPKAKNDVSEDMFMFKVINAGEKDFKVVQIGLQIGRTRGMIILNPVGSVKVPHNLEPDQSCAFWTEYEGTKKRIKKPLLYNKIKVKGYVQDYLGNTFWSNRLTIVLKETWHYKLGQTMKKRWQMLAGMLLP